MVFLGDLGRDLPTSEARYWRAFNIAPPDEGPSRTLIKRAFHGQFADPESIALRFPRVYVDASDAWETAFGVPLFRPLHDGDRHVASSLRVPTTDSQADFDEQVLNLAKLVVDYLNEEGLIEIAGRGPSGERACKAATLLGATRSGGARGRLRPIATCKA